MVCISSVGDFLPHEASIMADGPPRSPFDANSELPVGGINTLDEAGNKLPRRPLAVKDSVVAIPRQDTGALFESQLWTGCV